MSRSVEIRGLVETRRNLAQLAQDLHGASVVQAMRECTSLLMSEAKLSAPVDTGRYRASILPEVRTDGTNVIGIVGTRVEYAREIEFGSAPRMVSEADIKPWAERKGANWVVVQRAIMRRGTRAKRIFSNAFAVHEDACRRKIVGAITVAIRRANND
jgi:hypothetical protein